MSWGGGRGEGEGGEGWKQLNAFNKEGNSESSRINQHFIRLELDKASRLPPNAIDQRPALAVPVRSNNSIRKWGDDKRTWNHLIN